MARYRFGGYTLDTDTVEVHGPDGSRGFEPQVYDVLLYLIQQQGRLVTKEELLDNVWGDRFISESALTTRIKQARRLVDDDGRAQWAIKTVHGRGYRFIAELEAAETSEAAGEAAGEADGGTEGTAAAIDRSASPRVAADSPGQGALPDDLQADARRLFVGRDTETAAATALIDRPDDDPVRWVWLLGEPGIGKTRTAAEVAQQAHKRGHRVLFGRNNEDLSVPYQPIIEAMRSALAGLDGPELLAELGPRAPDLVPLLPELAAIAPATANAAQNSPLDDNSRRYQLMEAIADWLTVSSARTPTILVIDDVHWGSDSTLQVLAHLRQRQQSCRLTVIATARDTAPDENPKVSDLLSVSSDGERVLTLKLGGLNDDAVARLVGQAELEHAMQQTAGNPLLLQALNPEDESVDLHHAVRRRLASLPDDIQQVLRLAAIVGLEFDLKVLAAAIDRDELDVLDDVEHAMAARLLIDIGVDRFRFAHALIRSSLRSDISSGRRARWHARVAAAIDKVFPGDRSQLPAVAHHLGRAAVANPSIRPEAVGKLRQAAAMAVDQLSFGDAADLLQQARNLADPDDRRLQAELALAQGDAESRLGSSAVAMRTYDAALTDARQADDPELLAMAAILYASVSWRPGSADSATLERTTEALEALDRAAAAGTVIDGEQRLRAHLHIGQVRSHAMIGEFERTDAAYRAAWGLIEPMADLGLEGELLAAYLSDLRPGGPTAEIAAMWRRLGELEDCIENRETLLLSWQIRLHYDIHSSSLTEHRDIHRRMQTTANETQSTFWMHISANNAAMLAFSDGDLAGTEQLAEYCLELTERLPEEDGSGTYGLRMFALRREQDRLGQLAPVVRHLVSTNPSDAFWTPGLGLLSAETGQLAEAAAIIEAFKAKRFAIPIDAMLSTVMVLLAETAVAVGDLEACETLRRRLSSMSGMTVVTGHGILCLGAADRYLGMLSMELGDLDQARQQFEDALDVDARGGSTLWINHSRLWLAKARRAQGHPEEAWALADAVIGEAEPAGLPRLLRLARAERQA